ncbi:MAG: alginate export family protein [Cyclobacteriaceae bacterium]
MKKIIYLSVLTVLAFTNYASAQEFTLSGEVRPRTEMYNGNNSSLSPEGGDPTIATQQRTRLYFSYVSPEGITIKIVPQYINWWGGNSQTNGGTLSIFEASASYKFSDAATFKFGRQPISYGDQRFFGALGWAAPGRAFDAAIGKFSFGKVKLDAGITYNQVGLSNDYTPNYNDNHKSIQYLWLDAPLSEGGSKLSFMTANVVQFTGSTYTTIGAIPSIKAGNVKLDFSAYYQFGQFNDVDINSYLLSAAASFKAGSLPLTLGIDMVSGDDESTVENEGWKQQFGTNHKFYGFMDFFYVGEQPSMGLNDIYLKTAFKLGKKSSLLTHVHMLAANAEFTDEVTSSDVVSSGYLGTEIDLVYNLAVSKEFKVSLGYSQLFAADKFGLYKAGDPGAINNWMWLQLSATPTFFSTKK